MKKLTLLLFVLLLGIVLKAQDTKKEDSPKKELKPVLLVIDMQKGYLDWMDNSEREKVFNMINASIMIFRKFELPVVRVYHSGKDLGVIPGNDNFEFPEDIRIKEEDKQVIKEFPCAFTQTDLNEILKGYEANTLFMCGLSSTGCVLATYFGSFDYSYRQFLIKDALMSEDANQTNQIEEIFGAIDIETMMFMLEYLK